MVFLELGQRRRAQEFIDKTRETAEITGQANLLLYMKYIDAIFAILDGRLEEALTIGQHIVSQGEHLGISQFAAMLGLLSYFVPVLYLGRLDEVTQLLKTSSLSMGPIFRVSICGNEEAAAILKKYIVTRPGIGSTDDETPYYIDIQLLQAALRIGHCHAADLILRRFADCAMLITNSLPTCIPRHLGAAAALLGRPEEARRYYDEAIKVTTEMPFRPELALTRLQLAELLLEHYPAEKADALERLDFAIREFREMKMQPSLERALKLRA